MANSLSMLIEMAGNCIGAIRWVSVFRNVILRPQSEGETEHRESFAFLLLFSDVSGCRAYLGSRCRRVRREFARILQNISIPA